jgi:hypothetical protein
VTTECCNLKARMPRRLGVLVLLTVLALSVAFAQVRRIGDASFAPPEGWSYAESPRGDFARMIAGQGRGDCHIDIYRPVLSSGDLNADFRKVWHQLVGSPAPDISEHRSIAGCSGRVAVTSTDRIG